MSRKTLLSFFKPKNDSHAPILTNDTRSVSPEPPPKIQRVELIEEDNTFTRDPGLRLQIWQQPVDDRDEIRKRYLKMGPYQPILHEYPPIQYEKQIRRFQSGWFDRYPWLEYSIEKNRAYCFYCFLFETNPPTRPAFTVDGFQSWKRIGGPKCSFLKHMGCTPSVHMSSVQSAEDLMNPFQHIRRVLNSQSKEVVEKNRLRLKTSIECARWLAFQACAFRAHDESPDSLNAGNFIELIKHTANHNEKVAEVVLKKAPGNAKYTSSLIQKEILNILGDNVRSKIRKEIGDGSYCILVDEAQDVSIKEQMAIVIRFVDEGGVVRERFFGIVSVEDTTALTLKKEIVEVLSCYDLHVDKMRGQGYDGASNMRGSWNGLQALFLKECPYAYYMHCFAHQLQLALVSASRDVQNIWLFFSKLNVVVNIIGASPKRQTELQSRQAAEVANKVALGELQTGRGVNQRKLLHRAGATRWSSNLSSVRSLIDLFGPSCEIVENLWLNGANHPIRSEAKGAYDAMTSFEFVFILHLLNEIMGITDILCQALQQKSQDIVNAMQLVSTTKSLLQKLRETGWNSFFDKVQSFCEKHGIEIPNMDACYKVGTRRTCQQRDNITIYHHYQVDTFNVAIDFQIMELNCRFSEGAMEILILSSALDPRDAYKSFNIDDICKLAEKFYPLDFSKDDVCTLRCQLQHYELDIPTHPSFQNLSRISELCCTLAETRKKDIYCLVDRLIRLVLTLPVSTTSTERAFSAMKLVKTTLRNKMGDDFLEDCMILTIERELAEDIDLDLLIDDFDSRKDRRVQLH